VLCAIHQPNFFPWLGYFDKIRRADVFVFLDDVDYPRAGSASMGSWLNRVKIAIQGEARWIGCPVKRMPLGSPINHAVIDDTQPWRAKLLKSLEANYRRSKNYLSTASLVRELLETEIVTLADFNIGCITRISRHLGINTKFVRQSDVAASGNSTDLLIEIVRLVGADAYLAGGGSQGYQKDDLFATRGVELVYQNFDQKPYLPSERFIPGLSIIDYLMHDGRELRVGV
jgi:hypothetical protein